MYMHKSLGKIVV